MAIQPWRKGIITRIEHETPFTRRFWIQIPEVNTFDFTPGQFVTLDLPIDQKPGKRMRSYSIASWSDETNVIELIIVLLQEGRGTNYLFENGVVGAEITLRGPQGVFKLPTDIDKDLVFICTGTGIAPFRSMIHHINNNKIAHKNIYLIFGTRTKTDLLYFDEMKRLEREIKSFSYIPTLSREDWDGCCGYVHAVYENLIYQKMKDTTELPPAGFYLCGWKEMINEAKERILKLGYDKKAIHQEIYG